MEELIYHEYKDKSKSGEIHFNVGDRNKCRDKKNNKSLEKN